jgi:hypothetical protein
MLDTRRPALVTEDFRERLAGEVTPLGFVARKKALVRRVGRTVQRIELSSSHRNVPGDVTAWVALVVTDPLVARAEPGWRAGGNLGGAEFYDEPPTNVADSAQAGELIECVLRRLSFFSLMQDPHALHDSACRRYVPGILEPRILVPYLLTRLGPDAVATYGAALLRGRPELLPAFSGAHHQAARGGAGHPDHGTQLALQLTKHGVRLTPADDSPPDAVVSLDPAAASLRSFFGLQLRAWGEVDAAALLRRVSDERIQAVRTAQRQLPGPTVDSAPQASVVLREATGELRAPRRETPEPRLFQYHVLHGPFVPLSAAPK